MEPSPPHFAISLVETVAGQTLAGWNGKHLKNFFWVELFETTLFQPTGKSICGKNSKRNFKHVFSFQVFLLSDALVYSSYPSTTRINIIFPRLFLNSFFGWFVQSDSIEAKEIAIYLLKLSFYFCSVLWCVFFLLVCVVGSDFFSVS